MGINSGRTYPSHIFRECPRVHIMTFPCTYVSDWFYSRCGIRVFSIHLFAFSIYFVVFRYFLFIYLFVCLFVFIAANPSLNFGFGHAE